jgi:protein translocase SecG subunit
MNMWFFILTIIFVVAAVSMILIILVQRPQGGGLAGAFGGAGGSGTDTVFGGRVGDALTTMTVVAFLVYLGLAIGLNRVDTVSNEVATTQPAETTTGLPTPEGGIAPATTPVDIGIPGAERVDERQVPQELLERARRDAENRRRIEQGLPPLPADGAQDGATQVETETVEDDGQEPQQQ